MVDSLQLRAVSAGQGHGDEQHLFRAKGEAQFTSHMQTYTVRTN